MTKIIKKILELDKMTWKILQNWMNKDSAQEFSHKLTAWFFWEVIGNSLRNQEQFTHHKYIKKHVFKNTSILYKFLKLKLKNSQCLGKKKIFLPIIDKNTLMIASILIDSGEFNIFLPRYHSFFVRNYNSQFLYETLGEMKKFLKTNKIFLNSGKWLEILKRLKYTLSVFHYAVNDLRKIKPDLVVVSGDNYSPYQEYIFAAKKLGIKTMMLQHGLGCERYHDYHFTDFMNIWGEKQKEKYKDYKGGLRVTGNLFFEGFFVPRKINSDGDYYLWITRPHTIGKCYLPSRLPSEGIKIAGALQNISKNKNILVIIKPHPYDYVSPYKKIIKNQNLVKIKMENLYSLIKNSKAVISEDSTAALEAMFFGKPIIHVHFAQSYPVLKLVKYGAALPGFSQKQLFDSIEKIEKRSFNENKMLKGQINFIKDYAGPLTGTQKNIINFIKEVVYG